MMKRRLAILVVGPLLALVAAGTAQTFGSTTGFGTASGAAERRGDVMRRLRRADKRLHARGDRRPGRLDGEE